MWWIPGPPLARRAGMTIEGLSPALCARGGAARRPQIAAHRARARPLGIAHVGVESAGVLEVVEEERFREIIPLRLADAGRGLQVGELLERLDPFRHDAHAERMAERLDRAQ